MGLFDRLGYLSGRELRPALTGEALTRVGVVKIMPHVGCQVSVRRMIGALQPDDSLIERRGMLLHISEKVQFRHCRSNQQDLLGTRERGDNVAKETGLVIGMIAGPRLLVLGMTVDVAVRRLNRRLVKIRLGDVKDSRLIVVDPHR
jgi:hypothetical protein